MVADHRVVERRDGIKRLDHPLVGRIDVFYEALDVTGEADQTLFVYSTDPGSNPRPSCASLPTGPALHTLGFDNEIVLCAKVASHEHHVQRRNSLVIESETRESDRRGVVVGFTGPTRGSRRVTIAGGWAWILTTSSLWVAVPVRS